MRVLNKTLLKLNGTDKKIETKIDQNYPAIGQEARDNKNPITAKWTLPLTAMAWPCLCSLLIPMVRAAVQYLQALFGR